MAGTHYKKNFAKAKDKKISLILQTGLSLGQAACIRGIALEGRDTGETPWRNA
jgi:hypothetical protein